MTNRPPSRKATLPTERPVDVDVFALVSGNGLCVASLELSTLKSNRSPNLLHSRCHSKQSCGS